MITHKEPKVKNGKVILFFCRKKCNYSEQGINLMLSLGFELSIVYNEGKSDKLPDDIRWVQCDYIICFRSWFILPKYIIELPKHYSINLHSGPPSYPGSGCINFSLYNDEKEFGVTTHLMEEKVDSGKIINYETFPVLKNQSLESILNTTHQKLFHQLTDLLLNLSSHGNEYIEKNIKKNNSVKWSNVKKTIKQLDEQREIRLDFSEKELNKRIRSFHHEDFPLFIKLHNKTFFLKE